ncbi:MAG: PilN domain-containing protein, partial [Pseudomonadota bacterium]|nr:PilN domain-containing protein [Pseudomonadota bacterium]
MIHINLLPHREMERVAQRRRFGFTIATSMATAIILTALIHVWLVTRLNNQLKRNNYLEQVNNQLNQQIGQIRKLKTERTKVLAREKIIGSLEEKRFQVVRMLNEIPRLIPDGVYLTSLKETNKDIALNGMASSNY